MRWYLARHGEIPANIKNIYAGRSPEPLTANGRLQAKGMAEELALLGVEEIYCSPVARGVETAEIIGAYLGKKPVLEPAFAEIGLGPWEGKSESEVQREFPREWQIWNTRPRELVMPGRETLDGLLRRVLKGLTKIRGQNGQSSVLIVSHVAIIRVLLLHWQGRDLNLYRTVPIPHGKIFSLEGM